LPFPGNIRELKNIVERAMIISAGEEITLDDMKFSTAFRREADPDFFGQTRNLADAKNELERIYLKRQLELYDWNISKTAEKLGIQRSNLSRRIRQLDLRKDAKRIIRDK
jgi:two-component system nitrogen regulation response regulator NtrX